MAEAASTVTDKLIAVLLGANGLSAGALRTSQRIGQIVTPIGADQIASRNVTAEISERAVPTKYPTLNVYCERVTNSLREKFRTFSGKVQMGMDIRVSQDRLDSIERQLQRQVDVLTEVLDANRGDWGDGVFYTGGYEVVFGAVKSGGKNFLQQARITFDMDVSK
jgi:hypothetical protein